MASFNHFEIKVPKYRDGVDYLEKWSLRLDLDGCWLWIGNHPASLKGYGQAHYPGYSQLAHRMAHEIYIGPIPPGFDVHHTCHNPTKCQRGPYCPHRRCINPDHFALVSTDEHRLMVRSNFKAAR